MRNFIRSHRKLIIAGLVAGAAFAIFVVVWFQPQKLFQDTEVMETFPPVVTADPDGSGSAPGGPVALASGDFIGHDHPTTGQAAIFTVDNGLVLRIEDLDTDNGPDLVVWLSTAPADTESDRDFANDFVDLGPLKGNKGDQTYAIPDGVDTSRYQSVVIWCRRFTVAFGAAPLTP